MVSTLTCDQTDAVNELAPTRSHRVDRLVFLLAAWLIFRTLLWALVTQLTFSNPPLDTIELLSWGRDWQWGYAKHPPLPAWLADAGWRVFGGNLFGVYFIGYALIAVAVWSVWRLARLVVPRRDALLAALCMEGVLFYTYWGQRLNHNIALTAFWSLTTLFTYKAVRDGRLGDWIATGVCASLGLLSKYTMVFLLLPLLFWMLMESRAARVWRRPGPYVAALVMLMIVTPHLVWAAREGWPTLAYGRERTLSAPAHSYPRIVEPALFMVYQVMAVLPLVCVMIWGARLKTKALSGERRSAAQFLVVVVGGPLALHLALGLVLGLQLHGPWGTPFWANLGLLLIVLFPLRPQPWIRRRMIIGLVACNLAALLFLTGQTVLWPMMWNEPFRTQFPGKILAKEADFRWHARFAEPLPAVAGNRLLAGTVGIHASGRPRVYFSADPDESASCYQFSAQRDLEKMTGHGGILVWDATRDGAAVPPLLAELFPTAERLEVIHINGNTVGFALLPPEGASGR